MSNKKKEQLYEKLNRILKRGWPKNKELKNIPFGGELKELGGFIEITDDSIARLRNKEIPEDVIEKLQGSKIKDKEFPNYREFEKALDETLSAPDISKPLLFTSDDPEFCRALDKGNISEGLRKKFEDKEIKLSNKASISTVKKDIEWIITNEQEIWEYGKKEKYTEKKEYPVTKEGEKLNFYANRKDQIFKILLGERGKHVRDVVCSMNELLLPPAGRKADGIFADFIGPNVAPEFNKALNRIMPGDASLEGIFRSSSIAATGGIEKIESILRIAALYHDLGATIFPDRHTTLGFHYIVDNVNKTGTDELKQLDEKDERCFELICDMIKYHADFGVIGTGEGSDTLLIDTLPFRAREMKDQQALLSLLFYLTIADISGRILLAWTKAETIASELNELLDKIKQFEGSRLKFAKNLIEYEQDPFRTIERIRRLLTEQCPNELIAGLNDKKAIEEALNEILGIQFYAFWVDFALVCKLDYALRFVARLEKYAIRVGRDKYKDYTEEERNRKIAHDIINIVVSLIKKWVQSYSNLTKRADGTRCRIGIEVSGCTRTEKIADSLINLLFSSVSSDRDKGLAWAAEEATAWFYE